ncbi:hypothetical protein CTI14_45120 [Methylobacterium radiotolerans]|nr:hypothetical protein CTI14_45120 [Methylobacterium radiotolerans]
MSKPPRDRFDEVPRSTGRVGAHRVRLGMSAARYYQLLARLIDSEAALAFDPILVGRLRRLRDARSARRSSRIPGFTG